MVSLIRDTRVYGNLCHPICSPFGYREEQEIVCDVRHDIFDNFVLEGHISLFYLIYFIPMFIAKLYYVTFRGCPNLLGSYFKKLTNKTGKIGGLLFPQQSIPSEMYEHLRSVEINQKIFKDQLI